ncbi:hypothetical protein AQJ43_04110 [Streptomyces avermitilis]|nr:hypothetical protein AQJ43_04110 [Streptomyces avermitilis]MYS99209.1 hypothetical protein [Streptomyces sp. SID5469]
MPGLLQTVEGDFLLAVEAQGKKDLDKPHSWAYYLAHLYAKYKLPPVLLVVCQDRNTAAWAALPVDIGPPEWPALTVRPLVLGPDNVPMVSAPAEAARDIPLAVLSAMLHGRDRGIDAILKALAAALKGLEVLDPETATIFVELTSQGLDKTWAAKIWRDLVAVDTSFFTSSLSQEIRAEGEAKGRAADILRILDRRGIPVADTDRERITSCDDLDALTLWFDRAITAASIAEVFAEDLSDQEQ